jgi:hypothetical protein
MTTLGLAYLLWRSVGRPELVGVAAGAGAIAQGGAAAVIAAWLLFRDPGVDLGIETLGAVLLAVTAAVLGRRGARAGGVVAGGPGVGPGSYSPQRKPVALGAGSRGLVGNPSGTDGSL